MSESTIPRRTNFGTQLRRELDQRRMSIRKLARTLDPQRPEVARRNLARWIGGYNEPSRINRIAVAEALGLSAEAFLEDDDEEADRVMHTSLIEELLELAAVAEVLREHPGLRRSLLDRSARTIERSTA